MTRALSRRAAVGLIGTAAFGLARATEARVRLLNASYDSTRELYKAVNDAFVPQWQARTGQAVSILQSHVPSGQQARTILNGLPADVATLGSAYDVMQLYRQAQLIPADWEARLPDNSCPYTSRIVFLVRRGNPKNLQDWGDLVRPGVQVATPNPKTSGAARWTYLAAWAWAAHQPGASERSILAYMRALYAHVPVLDAGSRGATDTFIERGIGDVLLSWENEAMLVKLQLGQGEFSVVMPSMSILAEPPVTVVDKVVDRNGTRRLAQAYLQFLYTPQAQQLIAEHFFRPQLPAVTQRFAARFAPVRQLVTVQGDFGGWASAQRTHFDEGGTFDQIYGH